MVTSFKSEMEEYYAKFRTYLNFGTSYLRNKFQSLDVSLRTIKEHDFLFSKKSASGQPLGQSISSTKPDCNELNPSQLKTYVPSCPWTEQLWKKHTNILMINVPIKGFQYTSNSVKN